MDTLVSESNTLFQSIKSYLVNHPQVTDLHLYNVDGKEFEALNLNLHECRENFEETLSALSFKTRGERLLVVNLEANDLERFKRNFLSAYFFEVCFCLPIDWNCMFVDWGAGMSCEQEDKKGVFRTANLYKSPPVKCLLTFPRPIPTKKELFELETYFFHKVRVKCKEKQLQCTKNQYSLMLDAQIRQYTLDFSCIKMIDKLLRRPVNFTIRGLKSCFYGDQREHNPLFYLQKLHGLGYYSLTSLFGSTTLKTKFTYFEQGFKVISIEGSFEEIWEKEMSTVIFASKKPQEIFDER
jgi:hypothetical protein